MVRGFTPIIGLAVVVALALAAVFGSMSLANPAQAAIGQPADAELTERTVSPQSAPTGLTAKAVRGGDSSLSPPTDGMGQTVMLSWADQGTGTDNVSQGTWQVRWRQGDDAPTAAAWRATEASANVDGTQLVVTDDDSANPDTARTVTAIVSGLANDAEYHFQVRAGTSAATPSVEVSATPMEAPDAVDDLEIEVSGRDVMLTWDADRDASKWQVLYFTRDEGVIPSGETGQRTNGRTLPIATELENDSDVGVPALAAEDGGTPADTTDDFPAVPAINWEDIPNSGPSTNGHTIEDLNSGVVYHFWVRAVAGQVRGDVAAPAAPLPGSTVMTTDSGGANDETDLEPDALMGLKAESLEGEAKLEWDDPKDPGINGYEYREKGESSWDSAENIEFEEIIPGLTNGQAYTFEIRAMAGPSGRVKGAVAEVMVTPMMPTASILSPTGIPDKNVGVGDTLGLNLIKYYQNGIGVGAIKTFTLRVSGTAATISAQQETNGSYMFEADETVNIVGLTEGVSVVTVVAEDGSDDLDNPATSSFTVTVGEGAAGEELPPEELAKLPYFQQSSSDPGDSGNYDVKFQVKGITSPINTRNDDLIIEFHEDYGIPASIRNTSVAVTTKYQAQAEVTFTPEDVTVDGEKVLISLGDMDERDNRFDYEIDPTEVVNVHFRQSAGITTATEDGDYFLVGIEFGAFSLEYDEDAEAPTGLEVTVNRKISLSEEDGGLGDTVKATGKGYKNGTTLTVFRDMVDTTVMWNHDNDDATAKVALTPAMRMAYEDAVKAGTAMSNVPWLPGADYLDDNGNLMAPSGNLQLGEDVLCVARIGGDDVGACEFDITHPTFSGGNNYVNAVDGRNNYSSKPDSFNLEASIQARPASGSPGESIVIQIVDFPPNRGITGVQISRDPRTINCVGNCSTDQNGAASFSIIIPNWVKGGTQDLRVTVNDAGGSPVRAGTTVDLAGPRVVSTPQSVVANQRLSLVGTGFSPNAELGDDTDRSRAISKVAIGGYEIPWSKINDGRNVSVDDSGNWSASLDLPLVEATTGTGERILRVTDSLGRTGGTRLMLAERSFEVTPPSGRVGTLAVVRGTGYPGKNDEGDSFTIDVTYKVQEGSETRVSVVPDASGRFEVQIRIPTTAPIPSTNQVEVTFEHEVGGTKVTDVKQHSIPEGLITTSVTSGGPGSMVTLKGEGFKTFSPVESVKIGAIEITPAPKPSTDANGMMEFDILIPGLDVGIQTIEVKVGGTTSSVGFTVIASGVAPGDIKPTAEAVAPLGENLDSVWHFNNDSKAWAFYDGLEGSDLNLMITGETYLIQVKSTVEVILNGKTRNLTCNEAGNCWNQIVW